MGVCPRGAQVLRMGGTSENPDSSSKMIQRRSRLAFFYLRPGVFDPGLELGLVSLSGAAAGLLPAPAHRSQEPPHVSGVVAHRSRSFDHLGHPLERPEVGRVPVGSGSLQQHFLNGAHLLRAEPWHPAGATGSEQGVSDPTASDPLIHPVAHRLATDLQRPGHRGRQLARLKHPRRFQTALLHGLEVATGTNLGLDRAWARVLLRRLLGHAQIVSDCPYLVKILREPL
jgi:hypothetical protein